MTRQEKKEAQKAMEQALFEEEARQAIENKALSEKYGNIFVYMLK